MYIGKSRTNAGITKTSTIVVRIKNIKAVIYKRWSLFKNGKYRCNRLIRSSFVRWINNRKTINLINPSPAKSATNDKKNSQQALTR